jgi:hypothetical protein
MSAVEHVDLVEVDWASGRQRRLATVRVNGAGTLVVTNSDNPGYWERFLERPVRNTAGTVVSRTSSPRAYLEALHNAYRGSHFYATELHTASKCRFRQHAEQKLATA